MQMESFSKLAFLVLPFSVVVSACYLWGYWGTFNFDVFSYISISEITVLSAVPLVGAGIATIIGVGFGFLVSKLEEKSEESDGEKPSTLKRNLTLLDGFVLAYILYALFFGGASKWLFIPVLFATFVTILFIIVMVLSDDKKDRKKVSKNIFAILFVIVLVPSHAFGYGKYSALRIKEGLSYKYMVENNKIIGSADLRYLGKVGNSIILYQAIDNEIILLQRSDFKEIRFRRYTKPNSSENESE
jgi:hypothetical protein